MLPVKHGAEKLHRGPDAGPDIRPGSWWRLVDEAHSWKDRPAPAHGLILMIQEVRIVDGDIHTIVFHPHPLWGTGGSYRILVEEFLKAFAPEPAGNELREAEIAKLMARVQDITLEMSNPPDPMLLLERQTKAPGTAASAADKDGADDDAASSIDDAAEINASVPAALLPSQDVIEAQKAIETRIAAFEAQKDWITARTSEIQANMRLVADYQAEKVNGTLASISQETSRAKGLLQNVQTMRLFLGEDMTVTPLIEGMSADASEPLTFMQRMLYLDEEIIIHNLFQGFSSDQMTAGTLSQIFARDFSLVERMLPHPRSAVIVRVRRHERRFHTSAMSIGELFGAINQMEADKRVHILVRDGERLNMITADDVTSGAQRFFPSRQEIDGLFQHRSHRGDLLREISPSDIEYSDARMAHDQRALFYKRFLVLMWGMHERTDIFGPFMPKGQNWLSQDTHSEHFRFVHDEEDAITDGRPSVKKFISSLNEGIVPGSRVLAHWEQTVTGHNAPSLATLDGYRASWRMGVSTKEPISLCLASADKGNIVLRAPATRNSWRDNGSEFLAKVEIVTPASLPQGRPDKVMAKEVAEGVLCLDRCSLEDIAYYAESRAARESYLENAHLLGEAHALLARERQKAQSLKIAIGAGETDLALFEKALRLWRGANKWKWPETDRQKAALLKLVHQLASPEDTLDFLRQQTGLILGGIKANGDVFGVYDSGDHELGNGTPLPWLEERVFSNPRTGKLRKKMLRDWGTHPNVDEVILVLNEESLKASEARYAPALKIKEWGMSGDEEKIIPGWQVPRGLMSSANAEALGSVSHSQAQEDLLSILEERSFDALKTWMEKVYGARKVERGHVIIPALKLSLAMVHGIDHGNIPGAWVIDVKFRPEELAFKMGFERLIMPHLIRSYSYPANAMQDIAEGRHGCKLVLRKLSAEKPLAQVWSPDVCLSFENWPTILQLGYDMPKDDRMSWREIIAKEITPRDMQSENASYKDCWSADGLLAAARTLHVTASDAGHVLIDRLFRP